MAILRRVFSHNDIENLAGGRVRPEDSVVVYQKNKFGGTTYFNPNEVNLYDRKYNYTVYDNNNPQIRVAICQYLEDAEHFDHLYHNPIYGYSGNRFAVKELVEKNSKGMVKVFDTHQNIAY